VFSKLRKAAALLAAARSVRDETGKGVFSQIREMSRLRRGFGQLRATDYYALGVYDDSAYGSADKAGVVSWGFRELARLNNPGWWGVAADKLVTYAMLSAFALPFPRLLAVFDAAGRSHGPVPALSERSDIEAFLRRLGGPAFGKPVGGSLGSGAASIDGYDPVADQLIMAHDVRIGVADFVAEYVLPSPYGFVLQERVVPHPEILALTGPRVSTLRMVVLNGASGATLFRAMWKLAIGTQITDNYRRGTAGNLKAWVDVGDGRVRAAFHGRGADGGGQTIGRPSLGEFVDRHPDTGQTIVDIEMPLWEESVELVLRAAPHFPGLRYQSWDVALGDRGPTILELNSRGLPQQIPGFPGMNDRTLQRFIASERASAIAEHDYFLGSYRSLDVLRHREAARSGSNGTPGTYPARDTPSAR